MPRPLPLLFALLTLMPAGLPARAQDRPPAPDAAAIVEKISRALEEVYVFPEVAREMGALLDQRLGEGAYHGLDLPGLARQMTEDLQSVSHDRHLHVDVIPPRDLSAEQSFDREAAQARFLENARRANYGFHKMEILQGNVAYLDLRSFMDAGIGGPTAVAAMNFLASSDALIIDLRQNGGGSPSMIQLISSYFFDQPQHLNSFYIRRSDTTKQFWTQALVEGPKMVDTPIWILTGGRTFSAAEEFTYNLRNMERAQIVGETTGGGAHPVENFMMPEHSLRMSLPFGRAINPVTGTNWEGTGVEPHTQVPAQQALAVAHRQALETLTQKAEDPERQKALEWALTGLKAAENPVRLDPKQLSGYAGNYGPRRIWLEDGALRYQRGEGPVATLFPMGGDLFGLDAYDNFRIRFERDDEGRVMVLVGLYQAGDEEPSPRTEQ
jgi:hypothetical protein